ncbi:MAG: fibronectin type III domain-containing protein, partial [Planctomycetes bacterium]|nr:fibronectin type III domain-containing protein [Planctomycetota bacterium]
MNGNAVIWGTALNGNTFGLRDPSGRILDVNGSITPPSPENLVGSSPQGGQIALTWNAVETADRYKAYYSKSQVLSESNSTFQYSAGNAMTLTGLEEGETYHIFVTTISGSYESQPSNQIAVRAGIPTPQGFTVTPGYGKVTLNWMVSEGVDGYRIEYDDDPNFGSSMFETIIVPEVNSITISNLTNGQEMHFRIQSYSGASFSTASAALSATPGLQAPMPTVSGGASSLDVSWNAVEGATKYIVRYYSQPDMSDMMSVEVTDGETFTIDGLTVGTQYTVVVVAVDADDLESASSPASATALPAPPSGLTALPGNRALTVNWLDVVDATAYTLQWAHDEQFTGATEIPLGGAVLTHEILNLQNSQDHWVRIKVTVNGLESPYSASVTMAPVLPFPQNVMVAINDSVATATYDAVTNAVLYGVIATPEEGNQFANGFKTGSSTTTTCEVMDLVLGTTYYFYVYAFDSDNANSEYTEAIEVTPKLPKPENLVATPQEGAVQLTWNSVTGASGSNLYYSTTGTVDEQSTLVPDVTSPHLINLAAGVQVFFRVAAKDASHIGALSDLAMATS